MNEFSEDKLVEQTAIKIFGGLWETENFVNAFSDEGDASLGRDNQGEVVLKKYLKPSLEQLNPDTSPEAIEQAVDILMHDRSASSLVNANYDVWKHLHSGVKVEIPDDAGGFESVTVRVIDFENPDNNHFLLVSQLWVTGDLHKRRPDLVGFVNGIPLVLVELKATHKNLKDAYRDNIRDYKDTIPHLFWYNAFIIISNGIDSRVGTLTSAYEHFNEWKKIDNEDEESQVSLETAIKGTCGKERLLDIVENFTLFDDSRGERAKIVARYFQLLGVNRAFDQVKQREQNQGRLGVFWHTQGSGKSYSMIFLSQKVLRKQHGNFTFVVVTDRKELDKQIYKNFTACGAVHGEEVHADSVAHLKQLLTEDHRHVFTLIHKFADAVELSTRKDVIIMADEAHRTQYDRLAQNMRIALPNASFIGFTGTPLMATGEEKTRQTFGDYVSTYNFAQSVDDGATLPLFYENRIPKLENVNKDLQKDVDKVMDFYDLKVEEEVKLEQEFSTFYHLITREDRLDKVAEDITTHFMGRGYDGKAMVVSIDRTTAVRMYTKVNEQFDRQIAKLSIAVNNETDERKQAELIHKLEWLKSIDTAVVVSQSQNEIADLEEFEIDMRPIRGRMQNEDLESRFKDPNSHLRIVFVCAMWMTGFDVPNLSTLYLDKPIKNHTLMQTIARANRVHPGKTHGLIVDYVGVFRNLQKALSIYAIPETGSGADDIISDKDELVNLLANAVSSTKSFLKKLDLDIETLLKAEDLEKIRLVDAFANRIVDDQITKKKYLELANESHKLYKAVLPDPDAESFYREVTAYKVIATRIREVIDETTDVTQVKKDLEELLDRSIRASEYVIEDPPSIRDLTQIDFEGLREYFGETENKKLMVSQMSTELSQKIKQMMQKNRHRKKFLERLNSLLDEYNSDSLSLEKFFNELVVLTKDLSDEEKRSVEENLSEEELAIFDLIRKDDLNPEEEAEVKGVAQELLAKLKAEKLVLDWKKKEPTRADVKVTIRDMLYDSLPEPTYTDPECEDYTMKVFSHVFDAYIDSKVSVYG